MVVVSVRERSLEDAFWAHATECRRRDDITSYDLRTYRACYFWFRSAIGTVIPDRRRPTPTPLLAKSSEIVFRDEKFSSSVILGSIVQ